MDKDYQMVIDWMGDKVSHAFYNGAGEPIYELILKDKTDELLFNPKEDLNCWPDIYENMTDIQMK